MHHQLIYLTTYSMDKLGPSTPSKSTNKVGAKDWDQAAEEYDRRLHATLTEKSDKSITSRQPARQNFNLIWLDPEICSSNNPFNSAVEYLQHSVTNIHTFQDTKACIDFFERIRDQTVFMIIADALTGDILPQIHDKSEIDSIYVFCGEKTDRTQWEENRPKVIASQDIGYICSSVEQRFRQYKQDSIPLTFCPITRSTMEGLHDTIDSSFIYMKILAEAICYVGSNDETLVKSFAIYCRDRQLANPDTIDNFEKTFRENSAISWYIKECFLHSMINCALSIEDLEVINMMKFFIGSLHKQIESQSKKQRNGHQHSIVAYRGQGLSRADFDRLNNTRDGLISFNNFLSATQNRKVAKISAENASTNPKLVGILFRMNINSKSPVVPFAFLDKIKHSKNTEPEILFSMNSISGSIRSVRLMTSVDYGK